MPERRTLTEAERQASEWIVRMRAGDASDRERQEFQAWLNSDPAHAQAYAKLEKLWSNIASDPTLKGRATGVIARQRNLLYPVTAVAIALLLAIGAYAWFTQKPDPISSQHVETAPGELRTITLADGSTIELSGGSEVLLHVTDRERQVELSEGYALFDVQHDASRPFIVHTPQGDLRVLGTSFVIRVGDDQVRTTVLRGSVSGAAARPGLMSVFGTRAPVTAAVNQEIVLDGAGARVVTIAAEVIPRRLAWQQHMLSFDGETLNEAIAEVSRQTGWTFDLSDSDIGEMRVGGYVAADPEAFIELMSSSLGLKARRIGDRHVVLSRA